MAAYVGLDPAADIDWVTSATAKPMQLFAEGKIDAFLGFPPEPQELRAAEDRPRDRQQRRGPAVVAVLLLHAGRQHGRSSQANPVATKRVLRAILKAADLCAAEPERVAQPPGRWRVHARATTTRSRRCSEVPYRTWREYDPEDTLRFYALRLHEAGMIKSSPQQIIAEGTDWRFLERAQARAEGVSRLAALGLWAGAAGLADAGAGACRAATSSGCRRSGRRPTSP